jgi:hypothetical protein
VEQQNLGRRTSAEWDTETATTETEEIIEESATEEMATEMAK